MKKKAVSLLLILALVLGLAVPALAAGQTFTDVPSSYWGYADIEAVAEAGLMNGTGGGAFSPEMKVSVAQFLTLLGRLVFPDVKVEGADWFGPYVTAAQEAKLLDGTQVDVNNVEAEISRYDMAVILRAAAKKLGVAEKSAQSSEVKDYLDIPTRYADSVLAVYGMGLIRGDQAGNFNGSNTMMRAEVATVIMRLKNAEEAQAKAEQEETERKKQEAEQQKKEQEEAVAANRTGEYVTVHVKVKIGYPIPNAPVGFYFKDGRLLGQAVTNEYGDAEMDVTMDKADYSPTEKWYYGGIIGEVLDPKYGDRFVAGEPMPDSLYECASYGFLTSLSLA